MMANRCEGYKTLKNTFKDWLRTRYSSNTNALARQLKGITFGQGNRVQIDRDTYALSLSDCYWIKEHDEELKFEEVSPYFKEFWRGEGVYEGGPIPTLYVGGYLSKKWVNKNTMYKKRAKIEVECSRLCRVCKIPVARVRSGVADKRDVFVKNLTDTNRMLEQADQSGKIDIDNFTEKTLIDEFEIRGTQMVTIDAIFGNGDRHAGNFGYIRDTNTGRIP